MQTQTSEAADGESGYDLLRSSGEALVACISVSANDATCRLSQARPRNSPALDLTHHHLLRVRLSCSPECSLNPLQLLAGGESGHDLLSSASEALVVCVSVLANDAICGLLQTRSCNSPAVATVGDGNPDMFASIPEPTPQ